MAVLAGSPFPGISWHSKPRLSVSDAASISTTLNLSSADASRRFRSQISIESSFAKAFKACNIVSVDDASFHPTAEADHVEMISQRRRKRLAASSENLDARNLVPHRGHMECGVPLVKMCGITNVKDAVIAAKAGAKYVGLILWPNSSRSVSVEQARIIADTVKDLGAEPVGVFVDEDAETIQKTCAKAGIVYAQLHGDSARAAVLELPSYLHIIYVLHSDNYGNVQTRLPQGTEVDWILVDSIGGGSGKAFCWRNFRMPEVVTKNGWILAGGLHPENVIAAISALRPDAVDVSSGITGPDGILKDPLKITAFMNEVQTWKSFEG